MGRIADYFKKRAEKKAAEAAARPATAGAMSTLAARGRGIISTEASVRFSFFVLYALVLHLADFVMTQTPQYFYIRILLYALAFLFGLYTFSNEEGFSNRVSDVGRELGIFTALAFGWPWIFNGLSAASALVGNIAFFQALSQLLASVAVFVPFLLIYATIQKRVTSKLLHPILKFLYVVLWIIIAYYLISSLQLHNYYLAETLVVPPEVGPTIDRTVSGLYIAIKDLPGKAVQFAKDVVTGGKSAVQRQIAIAAGDYYTGQVDKSQAQPLGVYLENLQGASPKFYTDEAVIVWATITARSLDPERPIDEIKVSCIADKDTIRPKEGDASPEETSSNLFILKKITETEEHDLVCEFEKGLIREGAKQVTFSAEFDFSTFSYLKNYFIDLERKRSLVREGIDPFGEYGITDKQPIAIYSPGPVMVGMETTEPMIGISDRSKFRLGITVDSAQQWKGKIKKINDMIIKIPNSLSLALCDANVVETQCTGKYEKECEEGRYARIYTVSEKPSEAGRKGLSSLRPGVPFTINCNVNVDNARGLLGNVPLATQYFKTTVDYVYELEKDVNINIEKPISGVRGLQTQQKLVVLAEGMDVDPYLALGLAYQESKFDQSAVSSAVPPAYGIMQIREATAKGICSDPWESVVEDEEANIKCGLEILTNYKQLYNEGCMAATNTAAPKFCEQCPQYKQYRGWDAALRAYNGWGCGEGADLYYVEKIKGHQDRFKQQALAQT